MGQPHINALLLIFSHSKYKITHRHTNVYKHKHTILRCYFHYEDFFPDIIYNTIISAVNRFQTSNLFFQIAQDLSIQTLYVFYIYSST